MAHVADFLIALAERTDVRASYERDPRQAMTDFGLTIEEQAAVLSGDEQAIMKFCGKTQAKVVSHTEDDEVQAKIIAHTEDDEVHAKIIAHTEDEEVHAKIIAHTEGDEINAKVIWHTNDDEKKAA